MSPAVPFNRDVLSGRPGRVFLAEGVIDCLSLLELGLDAVGVPGAHAFKPSWVPLFARVGEVVVAFDDDTAGREGTTRISGLFAVSGRAGVSTVRWPEGIKDARAWLQAGGTRADVETAIQAGPDRRLVVRTRRVVNR